MATHNVGRILPIFKGNYDATIKYEKLDIVYWQGNSYVAKGTVQNVLPSNDTQWQLVAQGASSGNLSDFNNDIGFLVAKDFNTLNGQSLINPNQTPTDIPVLTPTDITSDLNGADEGKILSQFAGNRLKGELTKVENKASENEKNVITITDNVNRLGSTLTKVEGDVKNVTDKASTNEGNLTKVSNDLKIVDGRVTANEKSITTANEKIADIQTQIDTGTLNSNASKQAIFVPVCDANGETIVPNYFSKASTFDFGEHPIFICGNTIFDMKLSMPDVTYRKVQLSSAVNGKFLLIINLKEKKLTQKELKDMQADEYVLGSFCVENNNVTTLNFNFPYEVDMESQKLENWQFTLADGTKVNRQVFIYK